MAVPKVGINDVIRLVTGDEATIGELARQLLKLCRENKVGDGCAKVITELVEDTGASEGEALVEEARMLLGGLGIAGSRLAPEVTSEISWLVTLIVAHAVADAVERKWLIANL